MKTRVKVGIDTGGTFTDFVVFKEGEVIVLKIPSTPADPSRAIISGIEQYIDQVSNLEIIHGSTIATNALLEGKGAKTALITTEGFEDVIQIGRQTRSELFNLLGEKKQVLIPREKRYGIKERINADGFVAESFTKKELNALIKQIIDDGAEAVALCLLNSYVNHKHEEIILQELEKKGIPSSASFKLIPEYREYERTITTAANAYLMPIVGKYLEKLEQKLEGASLKIMQSNEGYISCEKASDQPIRMALSGPTGGVVGASRIASISGINEILSFDMGGTSTDVSLVAGKILRTTENVIGGLPIRIPMIDIYTVGAGGGSIAWIDSGGVLKVGPESAGADPGPACYGKGELPTVTDANLFLGRLDPDFFLGGEMKIFPERSEEAIKTLAEKLGKTPVETAEGIIRIANTNMEKALRVISVERGVDPRGFHLFSFGGAGGMHAVELADRLDMEGVIIPRNAGVLSAYGLLLADSIKDYSGSFITSLSNVDYQSMMDLFNRMKEQGEKDLFSEGFSPRETEIRFYMDLRYKGQSYEITVPFSVTNEKNWRKTIQRDFEAAHNKLYSYTHPGKEIEIITLRAQAVGNTEKIDLPVYKKKGIKLPDTVMKELTFLSPQGKIKALAYNRDKLEPGHKIKGPALIIDYESTSYLPENYTALIDDHLNIRIPGRKK